MSNTPSQEYTCTNPDCRCTDNKPGLCYNCGTELKKGGWVFVEYTPDNTERERINRQVIDFQKKVIAWWDDPGAKSNGGITLANEFTDLVLAERQAARQSLIAEIEAKAPKDLLFNDLPLGRGTMRGDIDYGEGFNAANTQWRSILKEVA